MKILFFSQLFYPSQYGGGELVFFHWAKELVQRGHDVYVITQNLKKSNTFEVINGIKIYRVGNNQNNIGGLPADFKSNFSYFISAIIKGIQLIRKYKIDVIHSNTYIPVLSAHVCSKLLGISHIVTIHDVYCVSKKNFWKYWAQQQNVSKLTGFLGPHLEKFICNLKVSRIHTVSNQTMKDVQQFHANNICVIPNGLDFKNFEKQNNQNENYIVFVGRLVFYKNVHILIQAFKKVVNEIPNARLIIIGDGPVKNELEEKISELGLAENVILKGRLHEDEKIDIICKSTALANPSDVEGFGMVILEAFACRKPVLVSNIKPLSDLVNDGVDGFLVDPNDVDDWASKMIHLLKNPNISNEMGSKGFKKASENFSLSSQIPELESIYNSIK